jgi:hypothetical protein
MSVLSPPGSSASSDASSHKARATPESIAPEAPPDSDDTTELLDGRSRLPDLKFYDASTDLTAFETKMEAGSANDFYGVHLLEASDML